MENYYHVLIGEKWLGPFSWKGLKELIVLGFQVGRVFGFNLPPIVCKTNIGD
jgi:hypothetical protein